MHVPSANVDLNLPQYNIQNCSPQSLQ